MPTTALISDIHLGAASNSDLLRREAFRERLFDEIADCDRLVLLGDTVELRDHPLGESLEASRPFFEPLGEVMAEREVVLVPGNHDHRLLGPWLERSRDEDRPAELEEVVDLPHPAVASIATWLGDARLEVRYPGVWVRDDVFATHGHYLDSHVTLPTIERLAVAAVDRAGGRPTGIRATPHDYEKFHAPVYDLIFSLAQGARGVGGGADGKPSAMRIWEMLGGASGRARTIQGRVLGSAVIPVTLRGLERAGFGSFSRDFSSGEIGRAGVAGMHDVVDRLGIGKAGAEHVIFGHIHRRGPLLSDDGRSSTDPVWSKGGIALHNTGNWMYVEGLMGRAEPASPFWPGSLIRVGDEGAPELVQLLDDVDHDVLAGRAEPT